MFLMIINGLEAQPTKDLYAAIESVVVYVDGAQVKRSGSIDLSKGKTTLVFDSLSPHIFEESIQIKAPDGVYIEAVNHQLNYLAKLPLSDEVGMLNQRQKTLLDSIDLLTQFDIAHDQEREMLMPIVRLAETKECPSRSWQKQPILSATTAGYYGAQIP